MARARAGRLPAIAVLLLVAAACGLPATAPGASGPTPAAAIPALPPASPTAAPLPRPVPYPVPASCPATPLTGHEARWTFPAWWLVGRGIEAGNPIGVFYAGGNKVFWHEEQRAPMRLTGERLDGAAAPVQISGGPETGGPSIVTFPTPGCWRLRAEADAQALDATVYVYPWGCRPGGMRGDPPPSPELCSPP